MSATIKDLEAASNKAREANHLATCTLVGVARNFIMYLREGHNTLDSLATLAEAVDAQRETEQAVMLAGAALLAALATEKSGEGASP